MNSENGDPLNKSKKKKPAKKPYSPPRLITHGSVEKITDATGAGSSLNDSRLSGLDFNTGSRPK